MRKRITGPYWIERPHFLAKDDYECSRCGVRQKKMTPTCPHCGVAMTGRRKDTREWEEEDDEFA